MAPPFLEVRWLGFGDEGSGSSQLDSEEQDSETWRSCGDSSDSVRRTSRTSSVFIADPSIARDERTTNAHSETNACNIHTPAAGCVTDCDPDEPVQSTGQPAFCSPSSKLDIINRRESSSYPFLCSFESSRSMVTAPVSQVSHQKRSSVLPEWPVECAGRRCHCFVGRYRTSL